MSVPVTLSALALPCAGLSLGTRHIKKEWKPRDLNARGGYVQGKARPEGNHLLSRIRKAFVEEGPAKLDSEG